MLMSAHLNDFDVHYLTNQASDHTCSSFFLAFHCFRLQCLFTVVRELMKRACGVNFCRIFISSYVVILKLAGSNFAQTLLNPSKIIRHRLFLLNVSVVSVNAKKCSAQNRVVFIKP